MRANQNYCGHQEKLVIVTAFPVVMHIMEEVWPRSVHKVDCGRSSYDALIQANQKSKGWHAPYVHNYIVG